MIDYMLAQLSADISSAYRILHAAGYKDIEKMSINDILHEAEKITLKTTVMTIDEFRQAKIKRLIEQRDSSVDMMIYEHSKALVRSSFNLAITSIEAIEDGE